MQYRVKKFSSLLTSQKFDTKSTIFFYSPVFLLAYSFLSLLPFFCIMLTSKQKVNSKRENQTFARKKLSKSKSFEQKISSDYRTLRLKKETWTINHERHENSNISHRTYSSVYFACIFSPDTFVLLTLLVLLVRSSSSSSVFFHWKLKYKTSKKHQSSYFSFLSSVKDSYLLCIFVISRTNQMDEMYFRYEKCSLATVRNRKIICTT